MDDNSESCATEHSDESQSDDDYSLDSSTYDDGLDYPPVAPSAPQPVASKVPLIGRLPLGGISGGTPAAGLQLNLGRCVDNTTEKAGPPSRPGNEKDSILGPRASAAIVRGRDAEPRISQCETPKGFVRPPKLTLSRPSEDLVGGGNQSSGGQGRDPTSTVTVSLLSHGLALDRLAVAGTPLSGPELSKALHCRVSTSMGVKMDELIWFEVRPLDLNSVRLEECGQLAVAVNRSGKWAICVLYVYL